MASNTSGGSDPSGDSDLCLHLGRDRCDDIIAVRVAASSLSLLGCFFIIVSIWLFYRQRNFAQRLILYLSIAALLDTFPYLSTRKHPQDGPGCTLQATWMSYFDWTVLLWACIITANVYLNLIHRIDTQHYERRYHALAWGFPIIPAVIPLALNQYGPAGAWCWIKPHESGLRFGLWYGPMFFLIIAIGVTYAYVRHQVRKHSDDWQGNYRPNLEEEKAMLRKHVQPLLIYPAIYLGVSIFAVINRLQNAVAPNNPIFALYLLHSLTSPMQGFANAVAYGIAGGFWRSCTITSIKRAWGRHVAPQDMKEIPIVQSEEGDVADWGLSSDSDDVDDADISYVAPDMPHSSHSWQP